MRGGGLVALANTRSLDCVADSLCESATPLGMTEFGCLPPFPQRARKRVGHSYQSTSGREGVRGEGPQATKNQWLVASSRFSVFCSEREIVAIDLLSETAESISEVACCHMRGSFSISW
jgi:hypothetical protein